MKFQYESINHDKNLPVKIFLHNLRNSPYHWHEDIELLFVLKGSIKVVCGKKTIMLKEKDLNLINSNEIHSTGADEDNLTLVIQINVEYFEHYYPDF